MLTHLSEVICNCMIIKEKAWINFTWEESDQERNVCQKCSIGTNNYEVHFGGILGNVAILIGNVFNIMCIDFMTVSYTYCYLWCCFCADSPNRLCCQIHDLFLGKGKCLCKCVYGNNDESVYLPVFTVYFSQNT